MQKKEKEEEMKQAKELVKISIGAALMPTFFDAVDNAKMGNLGIAAKTAASGGFALAVAKKFKL
jgi:hypothetical protein